jgi:hypothetical protein
MLAAERGQRVKACAAIVVGGPPRARDPIALLESLERRVERSVIDEERVSGPRLDRERDAVAMVDPSASTRRTRRSSVPWRSESRDESFLVDILPEY